MPILHPSRLLARDYLVIVVHKLVSQEQGKTPHEACLLLADREPEKVELPPEDDLVGVPYYEVEAGREEDSDAFRFIDPPFTGPVLPYRDVLERQAAFLVLFATSVLSEQGNGGGAAAQALARAVVGRRAERSDVQAKVFADMLHQHRWSPGKGMTGQLFTEALLAPAIDAEEACEQLRERVANPEFFEARMSALRQSFESANEEPSSLTDWAERLYRLRPQLFDLRRNLLFSELDGSDRRLGYVEHLDALIGENLLALSELAEAAVLGREAAPVYFRTELEACRLEGRTAGVEEALDEAYLHRRVIPRFWYEAARATLSAPAEGTAALLSDIDPYRILSIRYLEEWSSAWDSKATEAMISAPTPTHPPELRARLLRKLRPTGPPTRNPGPLPHPSRLRRRDYEIIRAAVEHFSLPAMDGAPPLWTALLNAPPSLERLPLEDDFVNVPLVDAVYDSKGDYVFGFSSDPPWTEGTTSYLETLTAQTELFRQWATLHRPGEQGHADQSRAFRTLTAALWDEGEERGGEYARALVDRWHVHRWSPGAKVSGLLLAKCLMDPGREDSRRWGERVQLENNGTLINARIQEVKRRVDEARESVRDLTEWAEVLYRIHPYVYELMALLNLSEGTNAEGWYELALQHLDTPIDKMPNALTAIDPYRAASIDALECWSAHYKVMMDEVARAQEGEP